MTSMRRAAVLGALAFMPLVAGAEDGAARRNWFGDPFFAISGAIADCPQPAGPYINERERREQAHHRAERGTTCALSGQCDRPNAYAYDRDIADALRTAYARSGVTADTTLWVTVQGRVVYIEGCVRDAAVAPALEAVARATRDVQQAVAIVSTDRSARPPYKLLTAP